MLRSADNQLYRHGELWSKSKWKIDAYDQHKRFVFGIHIVTLSPVVKDLLDSTNPHSVRSRIDGCGNG
jgi:hypothetical protein